MDQRPLRADARRNRERIVVAARAELDDLVGQTGHSGQPRLIVERVAARAGVGIGTLYRHFPTRDELVGAVYEEELTALCELAPGILREHAPADGLLIWLGRYADFVDTKRVLGRYLGDLVTAGAVSVSETRSALGTAVSVFLDAGAASGELRPDVRAEDVVAAMAGAVLSAVGDPPREQVDRLHALLVDGLRA